MKTSNVPNKTTVLALNQKAIEGVDKYLATLKTLTVAGTSYTPSSTLTAVLQAEIDGDKAVDDARAQYRQQVVAATLARSNGRAIRKGLKTYVLEQLRGGRRPGARELRHDRAEGSRGPDGEVEGAVRRRRHGHAQSEEGGARVDRRARPAPAPPALAPAAASTAPATKS